MSRSFRDIHASFRQLVDEQLREVLQTRDWPPAIRDAVEYSLLSGGKRLRPTLTMLAAETCGVDPRDALPAACAVEMIHTYSLIHDDLPSMDDDDLRRGNPTSHVVFGEALAILAGDALLTLAFETLSGLSASSDVVLECCRLLSLAAGGAGMVGGQVLDLEAERGPFPRAKGDRPEENIDNVRAKSPYSADKSSRQPADSDVSQPDRASGQDEIRVDQLTQIHTMKTGALISVSLEMGAVVACASVDERERLKAYGRRIGLAFQIADDLLDVTGSDARLGKQSGRDQELGKLTYPSLIGIDESRQRADKLIADACESLDIFGEHGQPLRELAQFIIERDH